MTTAQDAFATMLRDRVAPALRALGLKGSGQEFSLPSATHWAVLGFQRDRYSDSRAVRFTVNATVVRRESWARAYAEYPWIRARPRSLYGGYTVPKGKLTDFWHSRIGALMPDEPDHWWQIDSGTNVARLAADVIESIDGYVLPAMRARMT